MIVNRKSWPIYVRLGLYGIKTRKTALIFFWISIVSATCSILFCMIDPNFIIGSLFVFSAIWYKLSIKWVDKNMQWDTKGEILK